MKNYDGLTVNERLYISGLMDEFDKAVQAGEINEVKLILRKVEVDQSSITEILKTFNLFNTASK